MTDINPRPRPQLRPQVHRAARDAAARTAQAVAGRGYTVLPTREELATTAAMPTMRDAERLSGVTWPLGDLDVVWIAGPWDANEPLRHSMRSAAANVPHRRAWVAGHRPPWVDAEQVGHVPARQDGSKFANSTANLYAACSHPEVSDPFVWLHDDMFALRPVTVLPLVDKGPMAEYAEKLRARYRRDYAYLVGMEATLDLLRSEGVADPLSYEVHVPIVVYKEQMLRAINAGRVAGVGAFHKRSFYANFTFNPADSTTIDDPKVPFASLPMDWPDTWLSTSTASWAGRTGQRVRKQFHRRSPLEAQ